MNPDALKSWAIAVIILAMAINIAVAVVRPILPWLIVGAAVFIILYALIKVLLWRRRQL